MSSRAPEGWSRFLRSQLRRIGLGHDPLRARPLADQFQTTKGAKTSARSVTFLRDPTKPISVTCLNDLTGGSVPSPSRDGTPANINCAADALALRVVDILLGWALVDPYWLDLPISQRELSARAFLRCERLPAGAAQEIAAAITVTVGGALQRDLRGARPA